jgi:hypothetical protein
MCSKRILKRPGLPRPPARCSIPPISGDNSPSSSGSGYLLRQHRREHPPFSGRRPRSNSRPRPKRRQIASPRAAAGRTRHIGRQAPSDTLSWSTQAPRYFARDAGNERLGRQPLDRMADQCPTIVIAHQLATAQKANLIGVMENGRSVEQVCIRTSRKAPVSMPGSQPCNSASVPERTAKPSR